jgi:hypothetical protein
MIKRLNDLLILLAAAWCAWRDGGPDNEEIEAYAEAWERVPERNVMVLMARPDPERDNSVHFRDSRRLH